MDLIVYILNYLAEIGQYLTKFILIDITLIPYFLIIIGVIGFIILINYAVTGTNILDTIKKFIIVKLQSSDKYKDKAKYQNIKSKKKNSNSKLKLSSIGKLNKDNTATSKSFALAFILSFFNIDISNSSSTIVKLSTSILILSLVSFFCLLNAFLYAIAYIFIIKSDYQIKYPKLQKIIKYYKTTTLIYVVIEAIIGFSALLSLVGFSLVTTITNMN